MITFQGVDAAMAKKLCYDDIWSVLKKSDNVTTLKSPKSGFVANIDALTIGRTCVELGAGRSGNNSEIDTTVGIEIIKGVNESIEKNEDWINVYHNTAELSQSLLNNVMSALEIGESAKKKQSKITKVLGE